MMKRSVVVLVGMLALILAQGAVVAYGLSSAPPGDVISTEALGMGIDHNEFSASLIPISERLGTLEGGVGDAPRVVEQ
jgi:uncharacterized membrane protein